jgi:ribosomal protein L14E/L6E/L27E
VKARPTEPGRVVISTQGHDEGRWYAILSVLDERMVLLVDGDTRKLAKPKKKQVKHLRALPLTIQVEGKGASGGPLADSDIRKALKTQKDAYLIQTGYAQNAQLEHVKEADALVQE